MAELCKHGNPVVWCRICQNTALACCPDPKDALISSLRSQVAALTAEIEQLRSGIHPAKTPIEGGFNLDKFMPGLTPDDAATMGEALSSDEARTCRHGTSANSYCPRCAADSYLKKTQPQLDHDIADAERVIAWARDPNRKPASLAFTAGPERQAAYWIEWAEARRGEARIAALTSALGKAEEALESCIYTRDCDDMTEEEWCPSCGEILKATNMKRERRVYSHADDCKLDSALAAIARATGAASEASTPPAPRLEGE